MNSHRVRLIILLLLIWLSADQVLAGYTNNFIDSATTKKDLFVKQVVKKHQGFKEEKKKSSEISQNYQKIVKEIEKTQRGKLFNQYIKKPPEAIVFISLEMSDLSIKKIITDSKRYQIAVVIRGLYKNSFRKTAERIFNLVKEKNQGGVLINPLWFRKYEVKQVPALVISDGDGFDILYGNITISRALDIIAENGDKAVVAKQILKRGAK